MLKLTKKADYGLMALKYLAEHPEIVALSAKDIADAYGIPAQLLAKILQQLTKSGLLKSHAGIVADLIAELLPAEWQVRAAPRRLWDEEPASRVSWHS